MIRRNTINTAQHLALTKKKKRNKREKGDREGTKMNDTNAGPQRCD